MKKKWITLIALLFLCLSVQTGWADDLDSLSDDSTTEELSDSGDDLVDSSDGLNTDDQEEMDSDDEAGPEIKFGGYIKLLGYWNQEKYSDLLWGMYQGNAALSAGGAPGADYGIPPAQDLSGFNNVGTRLQLKVEGYLGEHARLFSAFNINYNTVGSIHDTDATANTTDKQNAEVRLVEAFVEIYEGSRIWKIGPQLVTWSYLEGMEVPTDRINARDNSYKSTEYEDSKLPSTGVLLTQKIGDSQLEIMAIPVAKTNIGMEFQNYMYSGQDDEVQEPKPNQTKWATRFSSTIGKLDMAVSYVEGIDPNADVYLIGSTPLPTGGTANFYGKKFNRIKSPGLDLQYNLGSWLAKLSYVNTLTEDKDGSDPLIKNSWSKYVIGGEFSAGGSTFNIYAGQQTIEDFDPTSDTAFLVGQIRERTDFISGHFNANFLTGDALNLVLMAANYWDEDGESVQSIVRGTFKYKIADGLEFLFSPSYMDMMDNQFTDIQTEIKYSF